MHSRLFVHEPTQRRLHAALVLARRQLQDAQIFLGRTLRLLHQQNVVGQAEAAAREQIRAVAVIGKRSWLAHQPVDDVPIRDLVFAATTQPRQLLHLLLRVPDLDTLGVQSRLDPLADQSAVHRVNVALHANRAARVHAHLVAFARLQPTRRQRPQQRQLFRETSTPTRVALLEPLPQERLVGRAADEIATATQHQRLIQCSLELAMALLHIAVLVPLARLDGLGLQAVMREQRLVPLLERLLSFDAWLHRCRQPIGAVALRYAAQFPQRVLHPLAEALQALRKADRARLPVRVSQHKVVDHVRERNAVDRHPQLGAMREIAGTEPTGVMDLSEKNLLGRAFESTPFAAASLQRPQLTVREAARKAPLQISEEGLGFQPVVELKLLLDLRPDLEEGIGTRQPISVHNFDLAGQLAEPAILACGLGVHADLDRCQLFRVSLSFKATKLPQLRIGDHQTLLVVRVFDDYAWLANREF